MFYSHEILTSGRYGVATVWLVATIGIKPSSKRLTKKAIQQVDVQKACKTIIEPPGAPIALRLQGSLLFGVSRVHSQQYGYLLADAEKVQAHMRAFYGVMQGNGIDPSAGKAKREHLILLDDPSFVLEPRLPDFDTDKDGNVLLPDLSQLSRKTSSQLSPLDGREVPLVDLKLRRSSSVSGNLDLDSPFGGSAGTQQPADVFMPFGEDEELPIGDFGLAIDADGTVIEEPGLPPHLPLQDEFGNPTGAVPTKGSGIPQEEEGAILFGGEDDVQMRMGEEALPEAEAFPAPGSKSGETVDGSSPQRAPSRKRRTAQPKLCDEHTTIPRDEFKSWSENYLAIQDKARGLRPAVGAAQARRNAFMLTFGFGIGNIGAPTGIPGHLHPLAETFAGPAFQESILGPLVDGHNEDEPSTPQGRRRSAREAFGGDEGHDRRVRRRADDQEERPLGAGLDGQDEDPALFDNPEGEVGREPGSALSDMAAVPWNRHSSVVPSSVKSKQSGRGISGQALFEGSPQVGHGRALPEIERYSDNAGPAFGSDAGFGGVGGLDSSVGHIFPGAAAEESQATRDALDRDGNDFLAFVEDVARAKGEGRFEEPAGDRRWVGFDDLFEPQDRTRKVVTQAFYHMLALATKSVIRVEQEGQAEGVPFGAIRLGVMVRELEPEPDEPLPGVSDDDETQSGSEEPQSDEEIEDHDDGMEE